MKTNNFSTGSLTMILIVIVMLVVSGLVALRLSSSRSVVDLSTPATTMTPTDELESTNQSELILQSLQVSGLECGTAGCTVDKVVGDFAKGNMPMAYWIAKKVGGVWQVVVTGNGIPQCLEIDTYSIPQEIYGNCIEEDGELRY